MKAARIVGIVLIVVGVAGVALALLADVIGIGSWQGFGWKQIVTLGVGAALAVTGFIITVKKT